MRRLVRAFAAATLLFGALQATPAAVADGGNVPSAALAVGAGAPAARTLPAAGPAKVTGQDPTIAAAVAALKGAANPGPNLRMGRLYMHTPQLQACTAALVPSPGHNLVVTAAHCLHPGLGGKYYTGFSFIPGYRKGQAPPFGVFEGRQPLVNQGYVAKEKGDGEFDFGFLVLKPNALGQQAGDVAGENTIAFGEPVVASRTVWAYLLNDTPAECFGQTQAYLFPFDSRIRIDCRFEPSSSGGPWLADYDAITQKGTVNGVISGPVPGHETEAAVLSPYFGIYAQYLYQQALAES
ncbi:trypsin-like serine peptidase [Streptomyces sp. NPDC053079]|uniref:trypsin-like serine peptidase n=1 Tax=Streptomyces sp. NPDC053079 TaxID=3365697 RepID=UPI0037D1D6DB